MPYQPQQELLLSIPEARGSEAPAFPLHFQLVNCSKKARRLAGMWTCMLMQGACAPHSPCAFA